ncbi:hypothetical protein LTR27_012439 [Elasticomyces elasticus]|nr:hypothetical protein LTR27_012439 [Elasticomyces elasticus]
MKAPALKLTGYGNASFGKLTHTVPPVLDSIEKRLIFGSKDETTLFEECEAMTLAQVRLLDACVLQLHQVIPRGPPLAVSTMSPWFSAGRKKRGRKRRRPLLLLDVEQPPRDNAFEGRPESGDAWDSVGARDTAGIKSPSSWGFGARGEARIEEASKVDTSWNLKETKDCRVKLSADSRQDSRSPEEALVTARDVAVFADAEAAGVGNTQSSPSMPSNVPQWLHEDWPSKGAITGSKISAQSGLVPDVQDLYGDLHRLVRPLANLLLPSDAQQSRRRLKFWGAYHIFATKVVQRFLDCYRVSGWHSVREALPHSDQIRELCNLAERLVGYQFTREVLEERARASQSGSGIPDLFKKAYGNVVLAFLSHEMVAKVYLGMAASELQASFEEVLSQGVPPSLVTRESVGAKGLLVLLAQRCTDRVIGCDGDIASLFSERIMDLEQEVWSNNVSRGPLKSLRPLRNELTAASIVLQTQLELLQSLEQAVAGRSKYRGYTDQPQRLTAALVGWARIRQAAIPSLDGLANELRQECEAQHADMEDWRSKTGIIFTTVTVIFLPLSVVAGIFGMNTRDVRDMEQSQWVFWATAVPFTLFVMSVTAWWAELLPMKGGLFSRRENKYGRLGVGVLFGKDVDADWATSEPQDIMLISISTCNKDDSFEPFPEVSELGTAVWKHRFHQPHRLKIGRDSNITGRESSTLQHVSDLSSLAEVVT